MRRLQTQVPRLVLREILQRRLPHRRNTTQEQKPPTERQESTRAPRRSHQPTARRTRLGDTQYPMYNHELVTTMYANVSLYHGRDGKRHVRSYYDLLREIAKLNGGDTSKILARLQP